MANRIILILMLFLVTSMLPAQTKISVDNYCLRKNTATLSQVLIDLKGKEFVSNLLESNTYFTIFCVVDSSGFIVEFKKMRSNKELSKELKHEIESCLKNISFDICYEKPQGLTECEAYKIIKKELLDKNKITHLININFPGELMSLYAYEEDRAKEEGLCLSKYEYLISMINKYITQSQ